MFNNRMLFNDLFDNTNWNDTSNIKCDIYEHENKYFIEMDIPGFKKEDIAIECHKGNLTIVAEKKQEDNINDKKYIRRERTYGKYERSIYLGEVNEDLIDAEFKDGILRIVVTKKEGINTKRSIQIK